MESPPSSVWPCIKPQEAASPSHWGMIWGPMSRKAVRLGEDIFQGGEKPLMVIWATRKESTSERSILATILMQDCRMSTSHPIGIPRSLISKHGKGQFTDDSVHAMRDTILAYIERIIKIGTVLSDVISLSFGFSETIMREEYLPPEPISIVHCFKYIAPNNQPEGKPAWGIDGHTGAYHEFSSTIRH